MKRIINKLRIVLTSVLVISSIFNLGAANFAYADSYEHLSLYVSSGNKNGDGSMEKPFGTVEEARDYIRTLKANDQFPQNGVTVNLREGIYNIINAIQFTKEDSGTEEGNIVYRAYLDEDVTINGGIDIPFSSFQKVTDENITSRLSGVASKAVVQYDLYNNGITREMLGELELMGAAVNNDLSFYYNDFTSTPCSKLYFNDKEMTIARWPNEGYAELGEIIDPGIETANWWEGLKGTDRYVPVSERPEYAYGCTFKIPSDKAKLWSKATDGRIYGFFTFDWYDGSDNIKKIDVEQSTLTMQRSAGWLPKAGRPYYVYNILEELDSPGEYYIDRDSGIMYFYPPASSGTCSLSLLKDSVFTFGEGADNIKIKNMTLSYGKHGVTAYNVKNVGIEGCTVNNINLTGVSIHESYNSYVSNCYIHDVGEHAIFMGGPDDFDTLKECGNYVENNWCHDWGQKIGAYSGAVRLVGVGARVSNNKFNSAPHLAVNLYCNDALVEYNDISDVLKTSADAGAIYTGKSWTQRGFVIRNNYIHDIKTSADGEVFGVYLDDFFCGGTVDKNIFANFGGGKDNAAFTGGGQATTVTNNICINTDAMMSLLVDVPHYRNNGEESFNEYKKQLEQRWIESSGFGTEKEYFSEKVYSKYPYIMDFDKNDLVSTMSLNHSVFRNNVAWNCKNGFLMFRQNSYGSGVTYDDLVEEVKNQGAEVGDSFVTTSNPGFTDYADGDMTLKENSEVYSKLKDFEAPDAANMGLYTLRLKNKLNNSVALKVNSPLSITNFKYSMIDAGNENVVPIIKDDTTLVPIRYLAETLGGNADWDSISETAVINVDGKELTIDNKTKEMKLDGEIIESTVKPCMNGGRFLVPLRVISEKFEKTVEWHENGVIIIGNSNKYFDENEYPEKLMLGEMNRRLTY